MSESQEPKPSEHGAWTPFDREPLDFRYLQDPVYTLSEPELAVLGKLKEEGLVLGLLPRFDPTSFLHLQVLSGSHSQRLDVAVDPGGRYVSFITRRTGQSGPLLERLRAIFGPESLDQERSVNTAAHCWLSFFLEVPRKPPRTRTSLFNFDRHEQAFLEALEACVRSRKGLEFHIYPRGTTFGGVELMLTDGRQSQMARFFVKQGKPVSYHLVTENTPLGRRLAEYLDSALKRESLPESPPRAGAKFLSLLYRL